MQLIQWREEFCTGIAGIDYEHQQLIEQINTAYAMIDDQTDKDSVIDHLGEIYGSISVHFSLEERLMERRAYDQYAAHKADHERLLDDIRDIADEFELTVELDERKFTLRLNDWFQHHFQNFDARLHKLTKIELHDQVDDSTMKALLRQAKNVLLRKTN